VDCAGHSRVAVMASEAPMALQTSALEADGMTTQGA
jgi:hypothetical protein